MVQHLKRGLHGRGRKLTGSDGDQGRRSGSDGRQQSVILLHLEVDKRTVRWGLNREKKEVSIQGEIDKTAILELQKLLNFLRWQNR
jgi:hypothetical protein